MYFIMILDMYITHKVFIYQFSYKISSKHVSIFFLFCGRMTVNLAQVHSIAI